MYQSGVGFCLCVVSISFGTLCDFLAVFISDFICVLEESNELEEPGPEAAQEEAAFSDVDWSGKEGNCPTSTGPGANSTDSVDRVAESAPSDF